MPDHPHCHSTALVFSLYTRRDIDSDDSYARPLVRVCAQPIVWFERERNLRAGHSRNTANRLCCFASASLLLFCFDAAVAALLLLCCFLCCFDVAVATAFATASAAASAA